MSALIFFSHPCLYLQNTPSQPIRVNHVKPGTLGLSALPTFATNDEVSGANSETLYQNNINEALNCLTRI